jgi:hypothetical protein
LCGAQGKRERVSRGSGKNSLLCALLPRRQTLPARERLLRLGSVKDLLHVLTLKSAESVVWRRGVVRIAMGNSFYQTNISTHVRQGTSSHSLPGHLVPRFQCRSRRLSWGLDSQISEQQVNKQAMQGANNGYIVSCCEPHCALPSRSVSDPLMRESGDVKSFRANGVPQILLLMPLLIEFEVPDRVIT